MSIAGLLTPNIAQAKDVTSKFAYFKDIADYTGADLAVPDTYTLGAFLVDFTINEPWAERTGELWNGDMHLKGMSEGCTFTCKFANRSKAVLQSYKENWREKIVSVLVEYTEAAVDGRHQTMLIQGELIQPPDIEKTFEPEFQFRSTKAQSVVTVSLDTVQTGAVLEEFAIIYPITTDITIAKGEFFGMAEISFV